MVGGIVLNGVATAAYVGARLGPGPRDGLMTGLAARTGWSLRLVRTGLEITVLAAGWLLGGTVGIGTLLYALAIGPLTQAFLPLFAVRDRRLTGSSRLSRPGRRRLQVGQLPRPHHDHQHQQRQQQPAGDHRGHRDAVVAEQPDHRGDQRAGAELHGAEQRGRGAGRLAVPGQRHRGRVGQREADAEQHQPQRHQHPEHAAGRVASASASSGSPNTSGRGHRGRAAPAAARSGAAAPG